MLLTKNPTQSKDGGLAGTCSPLLQLPGVKAVSCAEGPRRPVTVEAADPRQS